MSNHRMLNKGDIISVGDEYKSDGGKWLKIDKFTWVIGESYCPKSYKKFRRLKENS